MCNPMNINNTEDHLFSPFLGKTIKVKTIFEKPVKQVDIGQLGSNDLASLKKKDPFTFYSIPAAQAALMFGQDATLNMPKEITEGIKHHQPCIVTRRSRVSCEGYTDVCCADCNIEPGI